MIIFKVNNLLKISECYCKLTKDLLNLIVEVNEQVFRIRKYKWRIKWWTKLGKLNPKSSTAKLWVRTKLFIKGFMDSDR